MKEIVRLHGAPLNIMSDRETKFTPKFLHGFYEVIGTKICLSTAFHPQSDGQSERSIHTLEDMLRSYPLEYKGTWDHNFPVAKLTYNNNYHASIGMAPFEALYHQCHRTPIC